ncbi:MAG: aminodeoxychorismate synthase component I [Flavobacteriaceae bacterium]
MQIRTQYFEKRVSELLSRGEPFFFLVDYEQRQPMVHTFGEAFDHNILFNIKGTTNFTPKPNVLANPLELSLTPIPFTRYQRAFEKVMRHIKNGDSFLLNLTFPTEINQNLDLGQIYHRASAPYKLLYKEKFVCFSPECFIKIKDGHIYSYPMKGTIDATLPNARERLLNDAKETQEHNTIVDLIRNDLSRVAREVTVTRFRYVEKIISERGVLLQTSSEIRGRLPKDWKVHFHQLLSKLLPAGSISGAPKEKTMSIIKETEQYDRGFYTGIFGIFDGKQLESAVAIRYIEKKGDKTFYKSGGGITHKSKLREEYDEMLKKVYVPTL